MLRPSNGLCREAVDFRKGLHALAVLVESQLKLDPFASGLFVFRNRRGTGIKLLYWERNGFCLWQKKLEQERFYFPKAAEEAVIVPNPPAFSWWLLVILLTFFLLHRSRLLKMSLAGCRT